MGGLAVGMGARRIAEVVAEVRQHRFDDGGIERRGGVVVEIDGGHVQPRWCRADGGRISWVLAAQLLRERLAIVLARTPYVPFFLPVLANSCCSTSTARSSCGSSPRTR